MEALSLDRQKRSALPQRSLAVARRWVNVQPEAAARRELKPKCSPRHRAYLMADITLEGWVPLSQAAPLRYLRP